MKAIFTGGTCTTSRIEAKHRIYKTFLNSRSNLQKIFEVFIKLEKIEIKNYIEEIHAFKESEEEIFLKSDLIKTCKNIYSSYDLNKVKLNFLLASNYDVDIIKTNKQWYKYL